MRILMVLIIFILSCQSQCARILGIFPMPGISHNMLSSKLMKGLVEAGYDVTMISITPMKDIPEGGKYTGIVLDGFVNEYYVFPQHEEIMHQAFPNSPSLHDLRTNVSLVLLNSHTSIYPALPTVPNMVEIGGYFVDPPQKLPSDLQKILDDTKEGVIYFSMGSNIKSKDMPEDKKQFIMRVLGKLKQKVLWKFEEDLPGKPENVFIQKWFPQQDVLAHKNIKLFITHGGLLSTIEAIHYGVPILALPVFSDQDANADRAVYNEYGLKLGFNGPEFNEASFEKAINELLTNPKYRENVLMKSKVYHDRPEAPMKTATYWVDYVIRHKGAPHLRVAGVRLPWYQYYMVDVLGFIVVVVLGVVVLLKVVVGKLCCKGKGNSGGKVKTN